MNPLENVCPPNPVAEVGVLGEKDDDNVEAPRGAALGGGYASEGVRALEGSEVVGVYMYEEADGGTTDNGDVKLDVAPVSRLTTRRTMSFRVEKNPEASRLGSRLGAGGKMSAWNESAFRGTTKAMGSIVPAEAVVVIL